MRGFDRVLTAAVLAGAVCVTSGAGEAPAREGVGVTGAQVRTGSLSGPTTGPGGATDDWLDVTAGDRDGVVSEIGVEWTGNGLHAIAYVHRSCMLVPSGPGEAVTMRIPVSLPGTGSYAATVHARSVAWCDDQTNEQTGPPNHRRYRVRG